MLKPTTHFRQDFHRQKMVARGRRPDAMLAKVIDMLAADMPLPDLFYDHPLNGLFDDCRDCHIRTNLVLIYRKPDADGLELVRLMCDVFRLMKARNAKQRGVPFEPLIPTDTTVAAINDARRGSLEGFANSQALLQSLNADDEALGT